MRWLGKLFRRRRSLLTGSYAYGRPRAASDVDLVVLVDQPTVDLLAELADEVAREYGEIASVRFGKLNLICATRVRDFGIWEGGTAALVEKRPVSRDEAVEHFARLRHGGA